MADREKHHAERGGDRTDEHEDDAAQAGDVGQARLAQRPGRLQTRRIAEVQGNHEVGPRCGGGRAHHHACEFQRKN